MRRLLANGAILAVTALLCLTALEVASRFVMPIQAGVRYEDMAGQPIAYPDLYQFAHLTPNLHYRMISLEFDATVTHTRHGYRGPEASGEPEVLFLGDSFTFGFGLNNDQTIPAKVCGALNRRCANLGYSGSGTVQQMEILKHFLDTYDWHPREVRLLVMAVSSRAMSGNDFEDNLSIGRYLETPTSAAARWRSDTKLLADVPLQRIKYWALKTSNLARILMYVAGRELRRRLRPAQPIPEFDEAMAYTRQALNDFAALAEEKAFRCRVFFLSPLAELVNSAHQQTFALLQTLTPAKCSLDSLNPALLATGKPEQYFYALDGHYTPEGARLIADHMASLDQTPRP